jgi:ArsR family transcriptional regulator
MHDPNPDAAKLCATPTTAEQGAPAVLCGERFHRIAKALAEPKRLEILQAIIDAGELSCGAIVQRFTLSQPTVSHHLKVLTDTELVSVRREGQHGFFRGREETFASYVCELRRRLRVIA